MRISQKRQRAAIDAITKIIKSGTQEHDRILAKAIKRGVDAAVAVEMLGRMWLAGMVSFAWVRVSAENHACLYSLGRAAA